MITTIEAWPVILHIEDNEIPNTAIVTRKCYKEYLNFNNISVP